jgi:hypothetical protein
MAITSIKTGSSFTNLIKYNDFLGPNSAYMPPAFESIATATGTGSSNTITFSSIPQTYTHLQIRGIARLIGADSAPGNSYVQYNGVSTSTYFVHRLSGNGTSVASAGNASNSGITFANIAAGGGQLANTYGVFILDIHDYASTTKTKTLRSFLGIDTGSASTNDIIYLTSGSSTATTAITSISIINATQSFNTTTSFALYGIKGA